MNREEELLQNWEEVEQALRAACQQAGKSRDEITLLAVTKYAADEDVLFLLQQGLIRHVAESRVQQALKRWTDPRFTPFATVKHFIGHVQHNKAAKVAQFFDFIDSLDSLSVADAIDSHIPEGKQVRGLVQVKLTQRTTQSGLPLEQARQLARQLRHLTRLKVCGYMGIAPQGAPQQELTRLFASVRQAFEEDFPPTTERYLSLGMSEDFTIAVAAGSTLPRIGSKLFAANNKETI